MLDEAALAAALRTAIVDVITRLVPEALAAIPVPVLDVGTVAGVPPGTVIRLHQATVDRAGRYLRLTGSVRN